MGLSPKVRKLTKFKLVRGDNPDLPALTAAKKSAGCVLQLDKRFRFSILRFLR